METVSCEGTLAVGTTGTGGVGLDGGLLDVLYVGQCEPLKASVHGLLLITAAVCAAYNAAAWLRRREPHLAVNAVLYSAAVCWEARHVQGHLACLPESERSLLSEAA
jgi:hypothetical protein